MVFGFLKRFFLNSNEKELKKLWPIVAQVNKIWENFKDLKNEDFPKKILEFKYRHLEKGESLDKLLPEVFALVKEATRRVEGKTLFDVQILGGIVLHHGKISEHKTGEGKTNIAVLPLVLNSLSGRGVHLVTVNDYLAKWQGSWMGKIYEFLGLSVGIITSTISHEERKKAYNADITYGTNNEFGFDYLRDNLVTIKEEKVQRELNFVIVDEVDSILIDEARTPLIISAPVKESSELYKKFDLVAKNLEKTKDFVIDEKEETVTLTEDGIKKCEDILNVENLYSQGMETVHHIEVALKANTMFEKDKEYIVRDGEILIVDEFTGRIMQGRRFSDGIHQAIEAKENVQIKEESKTLATISFQNYFRLYKKLSGMTGTAITSAEEFFKVYKLDCVVVPTNRPMIRVDEDDRVYTTHIGKIKAIVKRIKEVHATGQPILIGTTSVESSEELSQILTREGVKHNTLNAKHHERESHIIAQAGRINSVTIATNMAGRGTDILLGGNPEEFARVSAGLDSIPSLAELESDDPDVKFKIDIYKSELSKIKKICDEERKKVLELGGLFVLATERHEARRIDDQLRGRSGRQGEPGRSAFYLSLDDDLLRIFGGDRVKSIVGKWMQEEEPIESRMVSRIILNSQGRVEGLNFDRRKRLIEYDDVINKQRQFIYGIRNKILDGNSVRDTIKKFLSEFVENLVLENISRRENQNLEKFFDIIKVLVPLDDAFKEFLETHDETEISQKTFQILNDEYDKKVFRYDPVWQDIEREVLLKIIDKFWMEHIDEMSDMRDGINLRGYAQRDPLQEYKREGFEMFEKLQQIIKSETLRILFQGEIKNYEKPKKDYLEKSLQTNADDSDGQGLKSFDENFNQTKIFTPVSQQVFKNVGRNDPCPCGSGKKYKKCHGL
ncbi:MAG: preprotein translocase subunit SecA [Patescibacteria group bacterium]